MEGSLNVAISEAENNTTKNIDRFKKTLKERIDKLKGETTEIFEKMQHEKYLLMQTKQEEACNDLSKLDEQLQVIEQAAVKYTEYEEILQV